ncbi:DKNYY domain-containing protein [Pinibacter aurantiacus]|uniref:DKNYY domain-containing protein n=1 Tax=Pinibacter aurantiacus TaxID=2851599 RepID=A0A9E2S9A5_9BACT|nr:DKNYY domain-containing protein [Pinibacter aurantiacus]MBV4358883.1 DKNYY domain-containing protein [Pinibacter aurantiacus]
MTLRQIIIIVLTISILTSCRRGYKVEGDSVYYEYWNEGSGQNKRLIEQADAKTFQKLTFDCNCNFEFGKDKDHLFMNGELIESIDPNTFKFIGNYIFRDKDSAYFFGFYNNLNDCVIKGVNPDKIELIKYPWAKAGNLLINGKDTVYLDDINDFVSLDDNWGKTEKHIINNNEILYGADVATFKVTSSFQGKDKNFSYEFGAINENDFKKTALNTFDFDNKDICKTEPIVFVDIYDSLVSYIEDKHKTIKTVEKLEQRGFTINNIRYSDWAGESKIISVSLANNECNCIVEKLYRYDYSKPSETKNIFKVTERIRFEPKEK